MLKLRLWFIAFAFGLLTNEEIVRGTDIPPFPGTKTQWHGYDRYDFDVDGRMVGVIVPKDSARGRPWILNNWYGGAWEGTSEALLARGLYYVSMDVNDMLGSPASVQHWNALYAEMTGRFGLSKKVALQGISRGGLIVYNWASANPEKVACIYGDAPVCDFKSWPGGGKRTDPPGTGSWRPDYWKKILDQYGLTEEQALAYKKNPVDSLEPLARAGVPILHVHGDADNVVPFAENTAIVAERYKKLGGEMTVIVKKGVGHEHGLKDPTPIIDFIVRHAAPELPASTEELFSKLETLQPEQTRAPKNDWLVTQSSQRAQIVRGRDFREIVLINGLISRTWRLEPNAASVAFDNLMTGESIIRGVKPEATIEIEHVKYSIGGLIGQPDYGYLRNEWLETMSNDPKSFQFTGFEIGVPQKRLEWKRKRYSADMPWPPPGVALTLHFKAPITSAGTNTLDAVRDLAVSVHYELFDGIPLISKWITVSNAGPRAVTLNSFTSEILAAVEYESVVDKRERWEYPNIQIQSDYSFRGMDPQTANQTTHWVIDPQYQTQVNSSSSTPNMLESRAPIGPGISIEPGQSFDSFRTFELIHDSTDRERKGLAVRQMYRRMAPWVTENPIMMHVRSSKPEAIRLAIDQCAEVGFEMVIISFWSGFDMENEDPAYLAQFKELADYAHGKGIELGAYSLLASRSVGPNDDVIDPATGKSGGTFGSSPCIGSKWGQNYFRKLYAFYEKTGMDLLEHDGSYPGDVCASTTHPGHHGLEDSQWTQWKVITDYYKWCRARGIYLNVPDLYYLNGSSKCGMGYRESNWSLPRAQQLIHARQNIYDGTWEKSPGMGWMLVPLVEYGGGGPAATIEPLSEHLDHFELTLADNFGAGVQACYRGPRLFDTDETKKVVKKWTDFYRKHRAILDSDVLHLRRPDARDLDYILHVNSQLAEKGLLMVFNPLDHLVEKTLKIPLHYTGQTEKVNVIHEDGQAQEYLLDRSESIELPVSLPAQSVTWYVLKP
ncbi:MAG: hypothetical protein JWM99_2723 [Verrucomicrobiales bacterium]|nr:hypothetical protein [Verrucomicrobiales bacterium]